MWNKVFWGHFKKQTNHRCFASVALQGNLSTRNSPFAIISPFSFFFFFATSKECKLITCLPLIKWGLYKPIQTRAMTVATKITNSESTQCSDTSISSPAGDRENRGGHYKDYIAGKVRSIFYPTPTPHTIPQTRPFSPGALAFLPRSNSELISPQ